MNANHSSEFTMIDGRVSTEPIAASDHQSAPSSRLIAGPANDSRSSTPGSSGSEVNRLTPPSNHNVMLSTCTSLRRATAVWASSWAISEAKNTTAMITPATQ